jgi:hypothetical protein
MKRRRVKNTLPIIIRVTGLEVHSIVGISPADGQSLAGRKDQLGFSGIHGIAPLLTSMPPPTDTLLIWIHQCSHIKYFNQITVAFVPKKHDASFEWQSIWPPYP